MHALIIEDSFLIAASIEVVLRELGFTSFDLVARAEHAIAAANARCPDLITSDARRSDGSGVKVVQAICADKVIPVLFLVGEAHDVLSVMPDALIIAKPFSENQLRKGVRKIMKMDRHPS